MTFVLRSNLYLGGIGFFNKIGYVGGIVLAVVFLALFLTKANKAKNELQK